MASVVNAAKSLEVNRDLFALHFALLDVVNDISFQLQHEEDKLSQLPDEILVSILSLISYKEAARTSVLSCRWKKLWTFIPVLDLDASNTLFSIKSLQATREERKELVKVVERSKYINCVNSVLDSFQGSTLEELRVRFDLDLDSSDDIQRWINFAFEKKVQRLVIDLRNYEGYGQSKAFTPCLPSNTPALGFLISTSLRVVQFTQVNISGEDVGYLLSTCFFLEHVSVKFSRLLVDLKVDTPLLHLKFLDITHCCNLRSVDISAPNLLAFRCYGPKFVIPFEKIPKVTHVFFGQCYAKHILFENPWTLSNYFMQLETLALDIWRIEIISRLAEFPKLPNLKNLELAVSCLRDSDNLLLFTPLVKSSPWLETFKLEVSITTPNYGRRSKLKGKKYRLKSLKLVEITGFRGCSIDNAFIAYLIENAVMLEKFIIDPRELYAKKTGTEHLEVEETQAAREKAMQLKHKFPSLGDKLLVL